MAAAIGNAAGNAFCPNTDEGDDCDELNATDTSTCFGIARVRGARAGDVCHASPSEHYAACFAGRSIPPLNTWNNEQWEDLQSTILTYWRLMKKKGLMIIKRVFKDGTQKLFTSVDLPGKTFSDDEQGFKDIAQKLGENVLIDSPVAR